MSNANRLTEDRLTSIEQGALEGYTLMARVVIELVEEVRRLRAMVGEGPTAAESRDVTDSGEAPPVIEFRGGWCAQMLSVAQWRDAVRTGPLQRFADFDPPTPLVCVISKRTPNSQPEDGELQIGTFVAPLGVPEDTPEAVYVALINAQAHEALESGQVNGQPYFDPHTEVGDYMLERTLTKWLEWKTGKSVVLQDFD